MKQATLPIFPELDINLMQGDCLELMSDIPDGSVDMIMADPPYGTTACKWDSIIPLEPMWAHLKRVIKKNGAIVLTASQPFTTTLISSNMGMFKYCWVWIKEKGKGHLNCKIMPLKSVEDVCVFYSHQVTYNPQFGHGAPYTKLNCNKQTLNKGVYGKVNVSNNTVNAGKRFPKTDLHFSGLQRTVHPTQKPVALMEYLIKTYTNEGETVLDFCMGSGTTGVASRNLNRDFIGIEKDESYFEIAQERLDI